MRHDEYFQRVSADYGRYSRWTDSVELVSTEVACLREFSGSGLHVIDVGAGTCQYLKTVIRREVYESPRLVAVDNSPNMLLSNHALDPRIRRLLGNLHSLPIRDGVADRIIGRQILHYVHLDSALAEVRRVLSKDGFFHSTQQVDYGDVPDEWYTAWSALRGAPSRRRLSDAQLTEATSRAELHEVRRFSVPIRLEYSWYELAHKYGRQDDHESIKAFFNNTHNDIRQRFNLSITVEGVSYTSRFRVSAFRLLA